MGITPSASPTWAETWQRLVLPSGDTDGTELTDGIGGIENINPTYDLSGHWGVLGALPKAQAAKNFLVFAFTNFIVGIELDFVSLKENQM